MYYNHEIDHVKGTTFERFAELYGQGNERQLWVGGWEFKWNEN